MDLSSATTSTAISLSEQFAVIMNSTPPPPAPLAQESQAIHQNSPPPSYDSDDPSSSSTSSLLQLLQEFIKNGGNGLQMTFDALNAINPRIELPSDPLKDISIIVGKKLSDEEIVAYLSNPGPWRPSSKYEFPFDDSGKRARYLWFKTYPFCTYSYIHDGIYCVPCALRSMTRYPKSSRSVPLINKPMKKYDRFSKKMKNHTDTMYHRENMDYINALSPNWMNPKVINIQDELFKDEII